MGFLGLFRKKEKKRLWPTLCERIEEDLMELQGRLSRRSDCRIEEAHRLYDEIGAKIELLQAVCYQDPAWLKRTQTFEAMYEEMGETLYSLHVNREELLEQMDAYHIGEETLAIKFIKERCERLYRLLQAEGGVFPVRTSWHLPYPDSARRWQRDSFDEFIRSIEENDAQEAFSHIHDYIVRPLMENIRYITEAERQDLLYMIDSLLRCLTLHTAKAVGVSMNR